METSQAGGAVGRRTGLALGIAATAGIFAASRASATELTGKGMLKVTALYGAPKDPAAFEKHYAEVHMPMVYAAEGVARIELSKPLPGPDGKAPPYYRITELWFESPEKFKQVTSRPDWKKIVEDVPNFATGGSTVMVSVLE